MDIVRITPSPSHTPTESATSDQTASRSASSTRPQRGSLTNRLNAEWTALVTDPTVAAELATEPIAGHDDLRRLLAACGGDRAADPEAADALLAEVVAAGLEGRVLARRVTFQRVLGALVAISVRRTRVAPARRVVLFDDLCATAWLVIGSYPLARRPRRIAANISRDAEYLTCVRPRRLHDSARRARLLDEHIPRVDLRGSVRSHPAEELTDLVFDLRGPGEPAAAEFALLHALARGASTSVIAEQLGCTERTVRNLRRRLLVRMRELCEPAST